MTDIIKTLDMNDYFMQQDVYQPVFSDYKVLFLQGLREGNPLGQGWAEFAARMDALYPHVVQVSNSLQAISNRPPEIRTAMSHELAQALSHGDGPFIWTLRGLTKGYTLVQAENADTLMSGVSSLYNSLQTVVKLAEKSHISRMLQDQQHDIAERHPMLFRIMKSQDKRLKHETFKLFIHLLGQDRYKWKYRRIGNF